MPAGTKGFAVALILRTSPIPGIRGPVLRPQPKKQRGGPWIVWICQNTSWRRWNDDGPKSSRNRLWPGKARGLKPTARPTGVPVVCSRRSRQHGEAAQSYPSIGEQAQVKRGAAVKNPGNGSGVLDVWRQVWAEAGSVLAGAAAGLAARLTGSCRTVAVCPTAKSVTRTILPLANSSAS